MLEAQTHISSTSTSTGQAMGNITVSGLTHWPRVRA